MKILSIKARLRALFSRGFVGTPDEAAQQIRERILNVRPRCSDLVAEGYIERLSGVRRRAVGGGMAAALRKVRGKR